MITKSSLHHVSGVAVSGERFPCSNIRSRFVHFAVASAIALVAGCVAPPPPSPAPKASITAKVPVIVALAETPEAQEKGGVEIAVVPVSYQPVRKETVTLRQVAPNMSETIATSVTGGNSRSLVVVLKTTESRLVVEPSQLAFTVRINNKLNRVFRGQGAVVQINVDGKMLSFDRVDYKQFINGIVPPRNEATVSISADALAQMPEKGTIGIYLYDVITATDVAGNTTEKQNYEWFFSYTTKIVEEPGDKRVVRQFMDAVAYQQHVILEQQQKAINAGQRP